jgi:hypothetical protein
MAAGSANANVKVLRKNGISGFFEMPDGAIYASPGGGYSLDGSSTKAVLASMAILRHARSLEKDAAEAMSGEFGDKVRTALARAGWTDLEPDLHLLIMPLGELVLAEMKSHVKATLGRIDLPPLI